MYLLHMYLKSRVNCNTISEDVAAIHWKNIWNSVCPINTLKKDMTDITSKCVPKMILQKRFKDKAWFDEQTAFRLQTSNS